MQAARIIHVRFRQSPFPGALVPSCLKAEETGCGLTQCPPGTTSIGLRNHAGSRGYRKRCWRKIGFQELGKSPNCLSLSTFPYSEGWVGITWPILQSRGFCTKIGAWVPPRKKIPRPEAEQCLVGNVVSPPVSEFSDGTKRPFCSRMLYQSFASEGRGCCAPY